MISKLEEVMRKATQKLRLEAEKTRAQKSRATYQKAIEDLDQAFQRVAKERTGDASRLWGLERFLLQRQAKSLGMLKQGDDGGWRYEKGKVDKDNRPAEKLVKGKVKGKSKTFGRSI